MTDTRVIAPKGKIGTRPRPTPENNPGMRAEDQEPPAKKPKRLLSSIVGLGVVVAVAVGYWFFMGPGSEGGAAADAAEAEVENGVVQTLEPISLNLAGGHYLRLGLGLQLTADAPAEVDAAIALDAAISTYSGHSIGDLADFEVRDELKKQLLDALQEPYGGDVTGIYYTDFVTQ